ncbi:MAG: hypothetical protein ACTSPO_14025 [Candidatus Heimdallarchaeaceae archaeon]
MQTQTLRDASFQVNVGKFLENIIDITNFKSEKVDSLLTNIGKIIDKVEDEEIKNEYNYILNNREKWKKEMVIKFEVYLFASRIDSNEIRRKIKSIGFNQDEMLNRSVNSTIAVIRRLRPYKNNQIFNFDSLIMELRKNRITNIIFNRISKNSRLQEIFNEMSGMFPPFSKLSLIELTSLLFILATPYLTQEAIDIPKINLNYKTNLESIIETFTIDTVSDWINFASDQFIACLIYAAPVLIFFGVRQDE